jgi:ABC-2 type transport system permease protein
MTITATALPTTIVPTAARPQPMTRQRSDDVAALPAALRSEWIKLRSLRSTPGLLAAVVVIGVLLSWILATFVKTDPDTHVPFTIGETFVFSTWLTMVLAIVMGTLSITSEVQHGTLATAVTTQPARWVIVAAKAIVSSGLGLAMGIFGMAAGLCGAIFGGLEAGDTSGSLATAGWGLLLTALAPMLGLGIGMIVRHSAGAVTGVLVWALLIENLVKEFAPASFTRLMPFSAAARLLNIKTAGDNAKTLAAALTRTQDAFVFSGYIVLALAIGTALLYRRDAN